VTTLHRTTFLNHATEWLKIQLIVICQRQFDVTPGHRHADSPGIRSQSPDNPKYLDPSSRKTQLRPWSKHFLSCLFAEIYYYYYHHYYTRPTMKVI